MLKVPYMKNPVSMALDSYEMNDIGKLTIGAMIAEAVVGMVQQPSHHQEECSFQSQVSNEEEYKQETYKMVGAIMKEIEGNIYKWHGWVKMNVEERRKFFIEAFEKMGMSHLIPTLTKEILDVKLPIRTI